MTEPIPKINVLSILVHGDSKVGKSTFTSTAPPPILVLDAEGSWKFIRQRGFRSGVPLRRKDWNPIHPPPRHDGTWEVCYVSVTSWETLQQVWNWIYKGEHDFKSIVLDSITELQRRLKKNISNDGVFKGYDSWEALLSRMSDMILSMRDLTLMATQPVECVVFVSETRQANGGRYEPSMQGQISAKLPYWVDICGYMYQTSELGPDGKTMTRTPHLWIAPHERFIAGERVAGTLPDDLLNPHLGSMISTIYQTDLTQEIEPKPNTETEPEND